MLENRALAWHRMWQGLLIGKYGTAVANVCMYVFARKCFSVCRQLTWDVIAWLRSVTKLKIVIKGIMTPDDASLAAWQHGVDGIWVSNHGARQVDTVPATIEVSHHAVLYSLL